MSRPLRALSELEEDDLIDALERRFDTVMEKVLVGGGEMSILRPRNSDALIREEDFVKDERLPYWADIWPSSTILAEYLLASPTASGERCLELGCGVGLVTTAAMTAGYDVTATDYYLDALAFTRANAWRNTGRSPRAEMIDWRSFPPEAKGFDLVLASDVLYEREYAQILPAILRAAMAPGGRTLIADPGRLAVPEFIDACSDAGLVIERTEMFPYNAGESSQTIRIHALSARD